MMRVNSKYDEKNRATMPGVLLNDTIHDWSKTSIVSIIVPSYVDHARVNRKGLILPVSLLPHHHGAHGTARWRVYMSSPFSAAQVPRLGEACGLRENLLKLKISLTTWEIQIKYTGGGNSGIRIIWSTLRWRWYRGIREKLSIGGKHSEGRDHSSVNLVHCSFLQDSETRRILSGLCLEWKTM